MRTWPGNVESRRSVPSHYWFLALTVLCGTVGLARADEAVKKTSSPPAELPSPAIDPNANYSSALIVPIVDEITDITRDSVHRRFQTAREQGVKLVIIELNTPGGMVTSTLEICADIRRLQDEGVKVYAWVNDKAYSGGTIIALATNGIIMAPNATIGDSQMIMMTPSGVSAVPEDLQAKATSPMIAELRDDARRNGYNMNLLLAFVRPEIEIYWLENEKTGERRFATTSERDELLSTKDDDGQTEWRYVDSAPGLPKVPRPIDGSHELLTVRTAEARAYGLAIATAANQTELSSLLKISGPVDRLSTTWMETLAEWLASPMVRGVLFLLMMLGAYAEFKAPGMSVPGVVALLSLVLFLGAPYMAGFTVTWEIVAVLLGVVLVAVEVFFIPGFGVVGVVGLIILGIGLIASFIPKELPTPDAGSLWPMSRLSMDYLRRGLWALASGTGGSLIGMYFLAKFLHKIPMANRLVAPNPTREEVVVDDPYGGLAQVGHMGRAEGILRPAGKARFGAILVDVVSDGEYIPTGARVEVIEKAGSRVVVRRVD